MMPLAVLERTRRTRRYWLTVLTLLAGSYCQVGRLEAAKIAAAEIMRLKPDFSMPSGTPCVELARFLVSSIATLTLAIFISREVGTLLRSTVTQLDQHSGQMQLTVASLEAARHCGLDTALGLRAARALEE